ncbi:MAG: hypothetical protein IKS99_04860 [Firmicutes bacterium]|nr:hypothetical protein [Bacillota bacterium]
MNTKKYLDFAFETAADTIDVGAFKPEEALQFVITGMKAYAKRNGYEFTDEEIRERAERGIKELSHAGADFDPLHRADSVNVLKEETKEDHLEDAFKSVANTMDLGSFAREDALKIAVTGMREYAHRTGYDLTDEEIAHKAEAGLKELSIAGLDTYEDLLKDPVNAPAEETKEDHLDFAFDSVANTLDLGAFGPKEALQFAVTGMKAYAYDNGYEFTEEEIVERAKKGIKELHNAVLDFEYQNWIMKR